MQWIFPLLLSGFKNPSNVLLLYERVFYEKLFNMKTSILFLLAFFFINFSIHAQTVNGVLIKNFGTEYVQITERPIQLPSPKINLLINYGQPIKAIGNMEKLLLDSSGKNMEFNSLIDALNFMSKNGYQLTHPYVTENDSFLMRRKKVDPANKLEEIQ